MQEWQKELEAIRRETGRHEKASHDYAKQNLTEQARLLKTLLSNCTFDRGSRGPEAASMMSAVSG